ncbi:MAG: alpha/beta hydrolase [Verrucomicrobiales bacterium]
MKSAILSLLVFAGTALADPSWQPLWEQGAPGPKTEGPKDEVNAKGGYTRIARPEFQLWPVPGETTSPSPCLVIFPGGGYGMLAMDHEGKQIAEWANKLGFTALVVKYRVSPDDKDGYRTPWPMVDAQRAVATARHRASEWKIDPARIAIIGFSAGGHLAAMTATSHQPRPELGDDAIAKTSPRPDLAVLVYPVISMDQPHGHSGSKRRLLGESPDEATVKANSPALLIDKSCPPLLLIHTADDPVSPLNSLDMARAAKVAGVPFTLHLYESGGHGYGLRPNGKPSDAWPGDAAKWFKEKKWVP